MLTKVNTHVLAEILAFVKPYKKLAYFSLFVLVLSSLNLLVLPVSARYVMDYGFVHDIKNNVHYYIVFAILTTLSAISTAWRSYLVSWIGERVIADMRSKLFSKILSFDLNQFETLKIGEILSRLTTDTVVVQGTLSNSISMLIRNIIQIIGALSMMFLTSIYLSLVFLASVPLIFIPARIVVTRQRDLSKAGQDKVALSSSYAGETLFAIHIAQAFTHEPYDRQLFSESVETAFKAQLKRMRLRGILTVIVTVGITAGFLLVFWLGSYLVSQNPQVITQGQLLQFIAYAIILASAFVGMADIIGEVQKASGASERLVELLNLVPTITSNKEATKPQAPIKGAISFKDIDFSYPNRPHRQVISNVSIDIKPGQSVALVGHSGAGKSTLLQLLLRFYDVDKGLISIDGQPINMMPLDFLRGTISFVPQEVVIFSGSIFENILYGFPEATRDQVLNAGRMAMVSEFADDLQDGYDTLVGERGMRLSGGQRQRIAIARAFLRDTPILLLDEATSNLDAKNERLLQTSLKELMKGRTTIVIAHRLATVMQADQIIFMQHGHVLSRGKHDDLVVNCEKYKHLASLQFIDG
tara:strand:- start:4404 stop:6158 length:1755 start_codon:yes stop_codon:yes gene_type:complete